MNDDKKLASLTANLKQLATNPPKPARTTQTSQRRRQMRSQYDSLGRTRQSLRRESESVSTARTAQAREQLLREARRDIVTYARGLLKP